MMYDDGADDREDVESDVEVVPGVSEVLPPVADQAEHFVEYLDA